MHYAGKEPIREYRFSHIRSQSHMDCFHCLLTRLPLPPARWEGEFGVPPAFTHTSFIGLQGGSRASLEMTIRRKRHPPITPTPFRWKEYPNSVLHTACTLSGPSGHLPHAGKAGDTGIPVPSHQSLVTKPPTQKRKSRRRFPFLAVYRKDDFQRADHTSLLKSPHVLKRARVARSWEMRLFLMASSSTMTMTLSR